MPFFCIFALVFRHFFPIFRGGAREGNFVICPCFSVFYLSEVARARKGQVGSQDEKQSCGKQIRKESACPCLQILVSRKSLRLCWESPHKLGTEYDRAKVRLYNGNDPPPAPRSLKALLFPTLVKKVENKGTKGVRARYDAELPPIISIVRYPGRPVISVPHKLQSNWLGSFGPEIPQKVKQKSLLWPSGPEIL